jgi:hypothetical protein
MLNTRGEAMLFNLSDFRTPLPAGVQVFASGANRECEIRGFARLGIPVGVSVNRLKEGAIMALIELKQPVLVDSGAFSEVALTSTGVHTINAIDEADWERRLALYLQLASALGERAMFVAPDKVGDQRETLSRLARYHAQLAAIAATGATILLPLQVGEMPHGEFLQAAEVLTGVQLTPAMPMRKAATTAEALLSFVEKAKPRHIHLLGIGIENRRTEKLIRALRYVSPATSISMDSNRLRAVAGKNRPLTQVEIKLRSMPAEGLYGAVQSPILTLNGEGLDYTDLIAFPSLWATSGQLTEIAGALNLPQSACQAFTTSPDEFLQAPCPEFVDLTWIEHPVLTEVLDRAWQQFVENALRSGVRSAAIAKVFRDSRLRNSPRRPA